MTDDFLPDRDPIDWDPDDSPLEVDGVYLGEGAQALEVVVARTSSRPTKSDLGDLWSERRGRRANPVLVVALYDATADLCGVAGADPKVRRNLTPDQAERICDKALSRPSRHAANRFLSDVFDKMDEELIGLRNQGLLSTHELKTGVPARDDWDQAGSRSEPLLEKRGEDLVDALGYDTEPLPGPAYLLTDEGRQTAVAVFLEEDETFDQTQEQFTGQSPVAYAINEAENKRVDYVIVSRGTSLRLYTTEPEAGFGSRGRTDTFVEADTNLLAEDQAAYVWLLFSAEALRDDGSLHQIMEASQDYAADLGKRLRARIYDDVVPKLAQALADARGLEDPTKEELDETYRMTIVLLYRLLFIAYAEDEGFLPRDNPRYDRRSLKEKAHELHELIEEGGEFDPGAATHWDDVMRLSKAIHDGQSEWALPEYNGHLLSSDPEVSPEGAKLGEVTLTDDRFGPVLTRLLIDETEDGIEGPVDFRNIGVREFGVIYEGLLESELSVADQPLKIAEEGGTEQYVPTDDPDEADIREGEVYLHGLSGERKATGTYYTKSRFVEHLLDYSLEPALDDHIERLESLDNADAEEAFFDFRVADIAMGSGHFLVAAVDRIESRLLGYLSERSLPGVEEELDRLQETAQAAFEAAEDRPELDRGQLLRRQVARRCIYGVDLNPLATELARLSIWVHTFVPGLPLTFLDYNLVTGDSLAGIGSLDELEDLVDTTQTSLEAFLPGGQDAVQLVMEDIDRLGNLADADAEQIREAQKTRREIEEGLADAEAAFDILAAARLDEDIDPDIVLSSIGDLHNSETYARAQKALEGLDPLHFPVSFPDVFQGGDRGFDIILGNPPWEKTKVERHAFWSRYYPGLQRGMDSKEREEMMEKLETERTDLVREFEKLRVSQEKRRQLLVGGDYPGIGSGDPDLYQAFCWRFWKLVCPGGRVGVVLPRGAFMQKGSEDFRQEILRNGSVSDVTFLKNRGRWAFPIGVRMTIGLISFSKSDASDEVPIRGPFDSLDSFERGVSRDPHLFSAPDVLSWTDVAAFPLLPPDKTAVKAFEQLQEAPRIDYDDSSEWKVRPYRTGITRSDCLDLEDPSSVDIDVWPVFKGSSFDIWDPDTGTYYGYGDSEELCQFLQERRERGANHPRSPFYEMDSEWIEDPETLPCFGPRIAFRRVTQRTNTRTVIASLIPPNVFLRDGDPFLLWPRGDRTDEAYLLGVLCSIPLDWYSRLFVEEHLDYYIFNGLPVPRRSPEDSLRNRVVQLAGRLAAVDERYTDWADAVGVEHGPLEDEEKQAMIHELDAVVAHLYGLSREHVEVIFETFHEGWDHEPRLQRVLKYYDEWEERLDD